jgi:hypothetical protein
MELTRSLRLRWSSERITTVCLLPPVLACQISPRLGASELLVNVDRTCCRGYVVGNGILFGSSMRLHFVKESSGCRGQSFTVFKSPHLVNSGVERLGDAASLASSDLSLRRFNAKLR